MLPCRWLSTANPYNRPIQTLPFESPALPLTPPRRVRGWYMMCASGELRPGAVRRFELGGERIVVFRGRDTRAVHALPGYCEHQGVDLGHGAVVGDCLRCPLHHWEYTDRCERIPGRTAAPASRSLRKPRPQVRRNGRAYDRVLAACPAVFRREHDGRVRQTHIIARSKPSPSSPPLFRSRRRGA